MKPGMNLAIGEAAIKFKQALEQALIIAKLLGTTSIIAFFIGQVIMYHSPTMGAERAITVVLNRFGEFMVEKVFLYYGIIFGGWRMIELYKKDTRKLYDGHKDYMASIRMINAMMRNK